MHVTEAHLDFYKDQGYVIIKGGLSDATSSARIESRTSSTGCPRPKRSRPGRRSLRARAVYEATGAPVGRVGEVELRPALALPPQHLRFLRNARLVDLIEPFIGPEIACNPVSYIRPRCLDRRSLSPGRHFYHASQGHFAGHCGFPW